MAVTQVDQLNIVQNAGTETHRDPAHLLVEPGGYSDIEVREAEGLVVKTGRYVMDLAEAEQYKQDLVAYSAHFKDSPLRLARLVGEPTILYTGNDLYRVRHTTEHIGGVSLLRIDREFTLVRHAMEAQIIQAVLDMPSLPDDDDKLHVGIDLVERNVHIDLASGELTLIDMSPPLLRRPDGLLNVAPEHQHFYEGFARKTGTLARFLVNAHWPPIYKPGTRELDMVTFGSQFADIIPEAWYQRVVDAMAEYIREETVAVGGVAVRNAVPLQP